MYKRQEQNSRVCSNCEAGKYSDAINASNASTCQFCPAGKWQFAGQGDCEECVANSNSPVGSTAAQNCTCNAGYFGQHEPGVAFHCTPCGVGSYNDVTGASACQLCPVTVNYSMPSTRGPISKTPVFAFAPSEQTGNGHGLTWPQPTQAKFDATSSVSGPLFQEGAFDSDLNILSNGGFTVCLLYTSPSPRD